LIPTASLLLQSGQGWCSLSQVFSMLALNVN
jgi:hypothetical protein